MSLIILLFVSILQFHGIFKILFNYYIELAYQAFGNMGTRGFCTSVFTPLHFMQIKNIMKPLSKTKHLHPFHITQERENNHMNAPQEQYEQETLALCDFIKKSPSCYHAVLPI